MMALATLLISTLGLAITYLIRRKIERRRARPYYMIYGKPGYGKTIAYDDLRYVHADLHVVDALAHHIETYVRPGHVHASKMLDPWDDFIEPEDREEGDPE